ncbi:MAG: hypothetical protein MJY73_02360 [Bacteroidales bacterium]|nr:hypothetical protein [Bacteroidales bacterium]
MKKLLLLTAALLCLCSCHPFKNVRAVLTAPPEEQQALRTRDPEIPIDSLFTGKTWQKTSKAYSQIAFKKYFQDMKYVYKEVAIHDEENPEAEVKGFKRITKTLSLLHSGKDKDTDKPAVWKPEGYSPGLTIYMMLALIVFIVMAVIRIKEAFFD